MCKMAEQIPMHPEWVICPTCQEEASGRIGVHSKKERRYKCHECGRTFAETVGTPLYGLKTAAWLVIAILRLLATGTTVQSIVFAFGFDERTIKAWQVKAGTHAKKVQEEMVCNGQVKLGQVQGDELYVKTQYGAVWMATAMSVFSRLFIWGEVSVERKTPLIDRVVAKVHAAARRGLPILWVTDGFSAWASCVKKWFRTPLYTGKPGRPKLVLWKNLHFAQVVKRRQAKRIVSVERRLLFGELTAAQDIVQQTQTFLGLFNTAYIERLNASMRTWIPALTRRSRTPSRYRLHLETAMFWTMVTYNFCRVHSSLNTAPAVAAGLSESVWSTRDLLFYYRYRPKSLHDSL